MRTSHVVALTTLLLGSVDLATPVRSGALVTFELYIDRAAFEARLGGSGAVRVVNFDDIDTSTVDPVPFPSYRYRGSKGVWITGENGQFVSRDFGWPTDFQPSSPPNLYAPGDNQSYVYFYTGFQLARVAGVGVVFVDADYPGDGPSSLLVRDGLGLEFSTGTVSGGNLSRLFRGIVAVDSGTNQPTPIIFEARIANGSGWAGDDDNEGVGLDDLVFATPVLSGNVGEICDNCLDDDGDGAVDRADAECEAPADGGGVGVGDLALGKMVLKCEKASAKAGVKFVQGVEKQLQSCTGAVLKCLQAKPSDPLCQLKAVETCANAKVKIDGLRDKTGTAMGKSCSDVPDEGTFPVQSFGYEAEVADCAHYGVPLNGGEDIGECILRQHLCRAEQLVSRENARALELATLGGLDVGADFPCIEPGEGSQLGLGDLARGKAALKCQQAIAKAGAKYASERQKKTEKCLDTVTACIQLKPNDPDCIPKAQAKCLKPGEAVQGSADDPKTLAGKAKTAIVKGCKAVAPSDLLAPEGLGQAALTAQCQAIGVPVLGSAADVADCLLAFHACRADRLIEKQYPRAFELRDVGFD
jgi:hypothetical protein